MRIREALGIEVETEWDQNTFDEFLEELIKTYLYRAGQNNFWVAVLPVGLFS